MGCSIKIIVAAVALIATNAAHAEWQFASGSATLSFAPTGIDALDASGAFLYAEGPGNKAQFDGIANLALNFPSGPTLGDRVQTLKSHGSNPHL